MPYYIDGRSLNTYAYNVSNRSASWQVPEKVGENIAVPGRHGAFWTPNKTFGEGSLTLSMWAAGCHTDGSLPLTEDGKRRVRQNLDKLTQMFGVSHRLLNVRQITGSEDVLINEVNNYNMTSKEYGGTLIARNSLKYPDLGGKVDTEVSRNVFPNPAVRGNDGEEYVFTEDLYPDPLLVKNKDQPLHWILDSSYYPIKQDYPTFNHMWNSWNGFDYRTGYNGRGLILWTKRTQNREGNIHVGQIQRHMYVSRVDKTYFAARMKMYYNLAANSLPIRITPRVSTDGGETWAFGTPRDYTLTKDYMWISIPADNIPDLGTGNGYDIAYLIEIVGPHTLEQHGMIEINKAAIQSAPEVNNPWRTAVNLGWIMYSQDMDFVTTTNPRNPSYAGHGLFRREATEWKKVLTTSRATTSPYGVAWGGWHSGQDEEYRPNTPGWVGFSVFGDASVASTQTWRQELPKPTIEFHDTRIWGRCITYGTKNSTLQVLEKGVDAVSGDTVYTQVGTVTIKPGDTSFVSSAFSVDPAKVYVIEATVPSITTSFRPALILTELHVSNGRINTTMREGEISHQTETSSRATYTGERYNSTIYGYGYGSYGHSLGQARQDSLSMNDPKVSFEIKGATSGWNGVFSVGGILETDVMELPTDYPLHKLNIYQHLQLRYHRQHAGIAKLTSANALLGVTFYDANMNPLRRRTLPNRWEGITPQRKWFQGEFDLYGDEVYIKGDLTIQNYTPFCEVLSYDVSYMVNLPDRVTNFHGDGTVPGISDNSFAFAWNGRPWFSQSVLTAPIPKTWKVPGYQGTDNNGTEVQFTRNLITVEAEIPASKPVYMGYKRGSYTGDLTIEVRPEGGTWQSLGTITATKDFTQEMVNVPSTPATYVDFRITGGSPHATVKEVFAITHAKSFYPIPDEKWVGLTNKNWPYLPIQTHPSSQYPRYAGFLRDDGMVNMSTGSVEGWQSGGSGVDDNVIGGGYIARDPGTVASDIFERVNGYVSVAARVDATPATETGFMRMEVQATTKEGLAANQWTTVQSQSVPSAAYTELKLNDVNVSDFDFFRVAFVVTSNAVQKRGSLAVVDGVTVVTSIAPLWGAFPGFFKGVVGPEGAEYAGHVRECYAEVVDSYDMESMAYGTLAEFAVNMTIPGAFWQDIYDTEFSLEEWESNRTSGMFYLTDFSGATAPMVDVVFEIEPKDIRHNLNKLTLTDVGTNTTFSWEGDNTSKITIDSGNSTVVDEAGRSLIKGVISSGPSVMLPITPVQQGYDTNLTLARHVEGTPALQWSSNVPIRITFTGRRKYLIS